jgi:PBP1b-binding outer membrane lipoprotein LpoB
MKRLYAAIIATYVLSGCATQPEYVQPQYPDHLMTAMYHNFPDLNKEVPITPSASTLAKQESELELVVSEMKVSKE